MHRVGAVTHRQDSNPSHFKMATGGILPRGNKKNNNWWIFCAEQPPGKLRKTHFGRIEDPSCYESKTWRMNEGKQKRTAQGGLLVVISRVITPLIGVVNPSSPFIRPFIGAP